MLSTDRHILLQSFAEIKHMNSGGKNFQPVAGGIGKTNVSVGHIPGGPKKAPKGNMAGRVAPDRRHVGGGGGMGKVAWGGTPSAKGGK